jgi:resuscitation-promoting factor RpfA
MPLAEAPLADAPVASEAAADASASAATAAPPAAAPPAAAPHPTYTTAARATARLPQARRPAAKTAEDAATAERAAEQPALDRIEVSGSRIAPTADALRAIPVRRDRALEPDAWLERIRARRDAGLDAQARESLRLFRRKHPEAPIPDDLQPLLR